MNQPYVITCGDEGVQINEGVRFGFAGSGFQLPDFAVAVDALKKLLDQPLAIVACAQNAWTKQALDLSNWEQANASAQQHVQVVADTHELLYAGFIPFADPKKLDHGVKGHMVRPEGMHLGRSISLTIGGGEQTYNLGNFVISAEWVADVSDEVALRLISAQCAFYASLLGKESLPIILESDGFLDDAIKERNKRKLLDLGLISE